MIGAVVDWMEDHPYLFLVPPISIFLTIDYLAGVDMSFTFVFTALSFALSHIALVTAKLIIKQERKGRDKEGVHRYSFPSYHTGVATMFCLVQAIVFPITAPLMAIFIILTAYGRVRLDLHSPIEVVGGFAMVLPLIVVTHHLAGVIV